MASSSDALSGASSKRVSQPFGVASSCDGRRGDASSKRVSQPLGLASSSDASGRVSQRAETSTEHADKIMNEIRALGSYPPEIKGSATRKLAERLRKALKA